MKLEIFDINNIKDQVENFIEMDSDIQTKENLEHAIANGVTRLEALNSMKETAIVYSFFIKIALMEENYELANKLKKLIDLEKEATLNFLLALNNWEQDEFWDDDCSIVEQMLIEINYINQSDI